MSQNTNSKSLEILPGIRLMETGKSRLLTADSIDRLRDALGEPLLNAFIRCLGVLDKLRTILDLMDMNWSLLPAATSEGTSKDPIRFSRNLHVLGSFAAGLVYECREGIAHLADVGIEGRLSPLGLERWHRLRGIAALKHESVLQEIRNCLAFHLGKPEIVAEGIANLSSDYAAGLGTEPLVISESDGDRAIDNFYPISINVISAGMTVRPHDVPKGTKNGRRRLDPKRDLEDAYEEVSRSHFNMVQLADDLLVDCLKQSGASIEDLDPLHTRKLIENK